MDFILRRLEFMALYMIILFSAVNALAAVNSCIALFQSETVNVKSYFRFKTPDEFFESLPREFLHRDKSSLPQWTWALPFQTTDGSSVPKTWVELFEYLKPGVVEARCLECKVPDRSRLAVAIVIARAYSEVKSGEPLSYDQLKLEAALLGGSLSTVQSAFRLEWRSPEEILLAQGFRPNPNKRPGGLWEHVSPDNQGTANLVSLTLRQANNDLINFVLSSRLKMITHYGVFSHKPTDLLTDPNSDTIPITNLQVRLYEYAISEIDGVKPPQNYSVNSEAEFVVPEVLSDQIPYYRKVDVTIKNGKVSSIIRSSWQRMP